MCISSVSILVLVCVMWSQVQEQGIKPLTTTIYHNSERQWEPSNSAMTTCIGYGSPKSVELASICEKRLPNAVIIGVTKCGTNALLRFLSQHPQIVRNTAFDEYHFFDEHYTKGLEWYRDRMPYSLPGQVVIDNTPNYFANKHVPERIFNINPNMKLVLAVRNPVDRAISEYAMHKMNYVKRNQTIPGVQLGDPFPPFEMIWRNYLYVFYDTSLEKWLQYFRIEQIHIVDGDVLRQMPLQELKQIEKFLNIESYFDETQFYFNKSRGVFCVSKPRFGQSKCLWKEKGRKHPKVNETALQMIRNVFRPHNQRFYKLSGKHFGWDNDNTLE